MASKRLKNNFHLALIINNIFTWMRQFKKMYKKSEPLPVVSIGGVCGWTHESERERERVIREV